MSWRNVGVVYRKELTDSLRDRRTLMSMIVVPIVLMPMLTIGLGVLSLILFGRAMQETSPVMVLGGEDSPKLMASLRGLRGITVVPPRPDYARQISEETIRAAVDVPRDFDAAVERGETAAIHIYIYQGSLRSGLGADKLQKFFDDLRQRTVRERLAALQLPTSLAEPFRIEQQNVAPPEKVGGALIGGLVPYFVIFLCLTGAMYPAIDLTAGEKERGTMETILCSPVSRVHLVLGKFFTVLTASLFTGLLSVISMGLTFAAGRSIVQSVAPDSNFALDFAISGRAIMWVFWMIIPLAVLFSAALLAIALFAKSYKEAQSYISPLMVIVILPAIVSLLPGVELNVGLSLIPVLNTSLVCKEIVGGTYHWNYIILIFGSSCVYAAIALGIAVHLFQREEVLFRT